MTGNTRKGRAELCWITIASARVRDPITDRLHRPKCGKSPRNAPGMPTSLYHATPPPQRTGSLDSDAGVGPTELNVWGGGGGGTDVIQDQRAATNYLENQGLGHQRGEVITKGARRREGP